MGELYPNHALESDDKEESEYASPMIISLVAVTILKLLPLLFHPPLMPAHSHHPINPTTAFSFSHRSI